MHQASPITLSSLYSSGQCLLSVLGSIGVILLFAGIPQLIYAPRVNPGSLMTFLLGALLISLMVAGNAFIGYKYRQLVRGRREENSSRTGTSATDDKPPSYDDLLKEEGSPPAYATVAKEKPPRYEELVTEVFNWRALSIVPDSYRLQGTTSSPLASSKETPIIVPLQRQSGVTGEPPIEGGKTYLENFAFESSTENLSGQKQGSPLAARTSHASLNNVIMYPIDEDTSLGHVNPTSTHTNTSNTQTNTSHTHTNTSHTQTNTSHTHPNTSHTHTSTSHTHTNTSNTHPNIPTVHTSVQRKSRKDTKINMPAMKKSSFSSPSLSSLSSSLSSSSLSASSSLSNPSNSSYSSSASHSSSLASNLDSASRL